MQGERQRVARNVQGCPPTSRALSGGAQDRYDLTQNRFPMARGIVGHAERRAPDFDQPPSAHRSFETAVGRPVSGNP